jgi:hypothetical protein
MTDREVEHGSRRDDQAAGPRTPAGTPVRTGSTRPIPRAAKRADPTEPEVPSAKRVRAIRKQRSLVLVAFAIVVLLAVVLFLLYKTGQKVTTLPAASAPLAVSPVEPGPPAATEAPRVEQPAANVAGVAAPSSAVTPGSPRPKASAPSTDIFRKPAF